MKTLLVRHGEAQSNVDIENGTAGSDRPLTKEGIEQVKSTAKWLGRVVTTKVIHSSPYIRTIETSEIIAELLDLAIVEDQRLQEIQKGEWAGKPVPEVIQLEAEVDPDTRHEYRPPGGENWLDVGRRVGNFVTEKMYKGHNQVLAVSHNHPIRMGIGYLLGTETRTWEDRTIDNASVTGITFRDGRWLILPSLDNVVPHRIKVD